MKEVVIEWNPNDDDVWYLYGDGDGYYRFFINDDGTFTVNHGDDEAIAEYQSVDAYLAEALAQDVVLRVRPDESDARPELIDEKDHGQPTDWKIIAIEYHSDDDDGWEVPGNGFVYYLDDRDGIVEG